VVGLAGQNISQLDTAVEQLWSMFGIPSSSPAAKTEQERRLAVFFVAGTIPPRIFALLRQRVTP